MDNFDLKITAVYYSVNYKERIYGLKKPQPREWYALVVDYG